MSKPLELVQFGKLRPEHFHTFPVWASCHSFDHEEEWFNETDEETFRPWTGLLPVAPEKGMFLVRSTITLQDGSVLLGFVTPQAESEPPSLGLMQPYVFLPDGTLFGFWFGIIGCDAEVRARFYIALKRTASEVFPAHFAAEPGLSSGRFSGEIAGFYSRTDLEIIEVQT